MKLSTHVHLVLKTSGGTLLRPLYQGSTNSMCQVLWQLHFVWWCLILCLWILSVELALCQHGGTQNCEVDFGKFVHPCPMYLLAVHKDFTVSLHRPEQGNRAMKVGSFKTYYCHKPRDIASISDRTAVHSASKGWGNS